MSQKLIPFYIIKVLEDTDSENPLRAKQIQENANKLATLDGTAEEGEILIKKTDTVVENIRIMNEYYSKQEGEKLIAESEGVTLDAYKNNRHYYLALRPMEFEEVHFLHRFALGQKNLTQEQSVKLAKKLENLLPKVQRKRLKYAVTHDGSNGTGNSKVYKNLDTINEYIRKKKNIQFEYYEYNIKKELVKRVRDYGYIVSPYEIMVRNGKYYLVGYHLATKEVRPYRIDKMMNVKEHTHFSYLEDEGSNSEVRNAGSINMFISDKRGNIKIRCKMTTLNQVIEKFPTASLYTDNDPNYFKATLKSVSYGGAMIWLKSHCDLCEVVYPDELRAQIQEELKNALAQYP